MLCRYIQRQSKISKSIAGSIQDITNYKYGVKYGEHKKFGANESLEKIAHYRNGLLYGRYAEFRNNIMIHEEYYINDMEYKNEMYV